MSWFSRLFKSEEANDKRKSAAEADEVLDMAVSEGAVSKEPALRINDDGTITDSSAGLIWQAEDDGEKRDWESANKYCSDLVFAGFSDWRLPSLTEFQSLDRAANDMGLTISTVFSRTGNGDYWSSSPGPQSNVAYVALGETMFRSNKYFVRAARSS